MPDGWAWSRLEPIASLITDYVANGSFASLKANVRTYKEKNYALFVRTVDFANNFKGDLSYIDKESYDFLEKSKLYGGELMLRMLIYLNKQPPKRRKAPKSPRTIRAVDPTKKRTNFPRFPHRA